MTDVTDCFVDEGLKSAWGGASQEDVIGIAKDIVVIMIKGYSAGERVKVLDKFLIEKIEEKWRAQAALSGSLLHFNRRAEHTVPFQPHCHTTVPLVEDTPAVVRENTGCLLEKY